MKLPADHPQRIVLNDEVHARPYAPLASPCRISYLALGCDLTQRQAGWPAIQELCRRYSIAAPASDALHFTAELGHFRLTWEQHDEFVGWMFIAEGVIAESFDRPAIALLPEDWVASLPGELLVAAHVVLMGAQRGSIDPGSIGARWFAGNLPIGSALSGGAATAMTDFRIHADGFSRHLLLDHGTTPWQAGRIVQRLLEIDTYRMMALLALPAARAADPVMSAAERDLKRITHNLIAADTKAEPELLDRLTRLEAEIEHQASETRSRFSAAEAYYQLVQRRIKELREQRVQGVQTFEEFSERRLAPAMNTCRSIGERQDALSLRASRTTRLLATRVDLTLEKQNQQLLEAMHQRAREQIRMQSTLEGLSIVAVTYYICGLVGRAAEALLTVGVHIRPEAATALSIPIVGLVAWLALHQIRDVVIRVTEPSGAR